MRNTKQNKDIRKGRNTMGEGKVKDKEKEVYNLGFQHIFGYQ